MTDQHAAERPVEGMSPPPSGPLQGAPPKHPGNSHARNMSAGFVVKLILVGLVDAMGVYGILAAIAVQSWAIVIFLVVALIVVNWVYFSKKMLPAKYLVPGLLFLFVYQLFAMAYTGYIAFTNYGDGHNSTKADAIEAILVQNERRVEGSDAYKLTVVAQGRRPGLRDRRRGHRQGRHGGPAARDGRRRHDREPASSPRCPATTC